MVAAQFTDGADPEYTEQILPLIDAHLPMGGVLWTSAAARARSLGWRPRSIRCRVLGLDPATPRWSSEAAGGGPLFLQGSATGLPLATGPAMPPSPAWCSNTSTIWTPSRRGRQGLAARWTFLLLLNHPLLQTPGSGWIDDQVLDPPEQYWRMAVPRRDRHRRGGRTWRLHPLHHRPLSRYLNAATELGLRLVRMEEPAPPQGFLARAAEYTEAASIPGLLFLRFDRR